MSAVIRSSLAFLDSSGFDGEAIVRTQRRLLLPLRLQTWWPTSQGPRFGVKRALDLAGALVGLIVFSPEILAIALLIRLDSPGPALLRQVRSGQGGRPFRVLNYRTMVVTCPCPIDLTA